MTNTYDEKARELALDAYKRLSWMDPESEDEPFISELTGVLSAALAACAREEREACKDDIQDAIGDWGGVLSASTIQRRCTVPLTLLRSVRKAWICGASHWTKQPGAKRRVRSDEGQH